MNPAIGMQYKTECNGERGGGGGGGVWRGKKKKTESEITCGIVCSCR